MAHLGQNGQVEGLLLPKHSVLIKEGGWCTQDGAWRGDGNSGTRGHEETWQQFNKLRGRDTICVYIKVWGEAESWVQVAPLILFQQRHHTRSKD
jgi:hypothetical protein